MSLDLTIVVPGLPQGGGGPLPGAPTPVPTTSPDPVAIPTMPTPTVTLTTIPSGDITMGVGPGAVSNLGIDLTPIYTLTSTVATLLDCTNLLGTLSLGATDALQITPICTALTTTPVPVPTVAGDVLSGLDLTTLIDDLLGLADGTGGAFTNPSYLGIGAADTAGIAAAVAATQDPTTVDILTATPPATLSQALIDAITDLAGLAGTEKVSTFVGTADALAALTTGTLGTVANLIGGLTAPGQATVLDALFALGLQTPTLPNLSNLTGLYTAAAALESSAATLLPRLGDSAEVIQLRTAGNPG
ncbi:MAG: hypothetical protein ACR2HR_15640 [Euzebya sp.]